MARGIFVTGIDTGVGKTVVSGALITALNRDGYSVCGMKPIETGCKREGERLVPSDGVFLKDASGTDLDIGDITPYCFESPLAPMVAAGLEKKEIDILWIERAFERLSGKYDVVVVEGIGGLLVPISRDFFVAHLAKMMGLPLIIVSTPYLGTLNHTLLTVDYALDNGFDVAGVVINNYRPPKGSLAESTNPEALHSLCRVPVLGSIPYLSEINKDTLNRAASENLRLDIVERYMQGSGGEAAVSI
jgi:dethiobiotin synthetase